MDDVDYLDIFALPILKTSITDGDLISRVEKSILAVRETHPDDLKISSLVKAKKEYSGTFSDPMSGVDGTDELVEYAKQAGLMYLEKFGASKKILVEKKSYWKSVAWWNVFEEGEWYPFHDHHMTTLSCVVYIRQEDYHTGLKFKHPCGTLINTWFKSTGFGLGTSNGTEFTLKCKTGDLVVFPPWLEHGVPHDSTEGLKNRQLIVRKHSFTSGMSAPPGTNKSKTTHLPRISVAIDLK